MSLASTKRHEQEYDTSTKVNKGASGLVGLEMPWPGYLPRDEVVGDVKNRLARAQNDKVNVIIIIYIKNYTTT